jgi:hypothetical protein
MNKGLAAALGVLALGATTFAAAPAHGACRPVAHGTVCEEPGSASPGPGTPLPEQFFVAPGAIEPLPVNPVIEEEFTAGLRAREARGKAVVADDPQIRLTPATEGGWAGWCITAQEGAHQSTRCPIAPSGDMIAYERWETSGQEARGYALTSSAADAVAVDEQGSVPTVPIKGFAGEFSAALVGIPGTMPAGRWPDEFEAVSQGVRESSHHGLGQAPTTPSISLPATYWKAPQVPPSGPCAIGSSHLPGLRSRWGHVVGVVRPVPELARGGYISCDDTKLSVRGSSLDAAILVDAAQPGSAPPQPLPNAHLVGSHHGLYTAPGWSGAILARRVGDAWLLVEGGRGLRQRESVLAHLRATVRL